MSENIVQDVTYSKEGDGKVSIEVSWCLPLEWVYFYEEEAGHEVRSRGLRNVHTAGCPSLPADIFSLILPAGISRVGVSSTATRESMLPGSWYVVPALEPYLECNPAPPRKENPEVYSLDAYWPKKVVELRGKREVSGAQTVVVRLMPIRYNPVQKTVMVSSGLRFVLECEPAGSFGRYPIRVWQELGLAPYKPVGWQELRSFESSL